jgi:triosephosphate isomerase
MLAEFCQYVIIGHSERRGYFGETDQDVNRKVKSALAHGLIPIMCVGETLEENEAGQTQAVVTRQVRAGLDGIEAAPFVIAYEPVWAIGTGKAATAAGANQVIGGIVRDVLRQTYTQEFAEQVRILYGGSVKSGNAREFFKQPDIDGALVGGASLIASEFITIVKAATD